MNKKKSEQPIIMQFYITQRRWLDEIKTDLERTKIPVQQIGVFINDFISQMIAGDTKILVGINLTFLSCKKQPTCIQLH